MTEKTIHINLESVAAGIGIVPNPNLDLTWCADKNGMTALKVTPKKKAHDFKDKWVLLFDSIKFEQAIIEFDALGQSEPPQSNFLGIAFHATDDKTHDAVYYRPFNFKAEDPTRKIHAVQYVSHPEYPWFDLRRDMTDQFEKAVIPSPDGDSWFHAKIEITQPEIRAYIGDSEVPSLVVNELIPRKEKGFGLWCGPGVGGYFSNIKIIIIK
nr:hypothetical protein [uncultured Tolumonas sp.]